MSKKLICDKCGKEGTRNYEWSTFNYHWPVGNGTWKCFIHDICLDCADEFKKTFKIEKE